MRDAIVVGAGLSGLVCARRLVEAGADVAVVEARRRVGGRLVSGRVGDATVDLGGQWLSVGQPRLLALAAQLRVSSQPQPRTGRAVLDDGQPRGLFRQLAAAVAQWRAARRIERLAARAPGGAPADPADAALDAVALGPWLAGSINSPRGGAALRGPAEPGLSIGHPTARARIAMHAELLLAADPASISLLSYLARLGTTGGFAPRGPDLPGGGRDHCFVGGAHQLPLALTDQLAPRIQLATAVTSVERSRDSLVVHTAAGSLTARHVVLALPPRLAAPLAPTLPPALHQLAAAHQPGSVVKCFAAYDRPFWRDDGLSGEAYRPHGAIRAVVDASYSGSAILCAFIVGSAAASWHTHPADARRTIVTSTLGDLFGEPARHPLDYLEADWSIDPWSAGCVASTPPGALAALPPGTRWHGSHDRIHLAGAEAATRWPGYMEGAIEAGEHAATAILGSTD